MMSRDSMLGQLRQYVGFAGTGWRWLGAAIAGSLVLALLDTLGVVAMVPLMSLFAGADAGEGVLGVVSRLAGTTDVAVLTPIVAGLVALAFILKSACTVPFRWWLVGRATRVSADAATEMLRLYVLSPFSIHRTRRLPDIYRNVGDATAQSSSVLLAAVSVVSDVLIVTAIFVVLLIASPIVTAVMIVFFGSLMGAIQLVLRRHQARVGEEMLAANLQGWRSMMPALDGFREARLTSSAHVFVGEYRDARSRLANAQRTLSVVSEVPRYLLEVGFVLAIVGIALVLFAFGDTDSALTVLGLFAVASMRALPTLNRISASAATIRSGRAGLRIACDAIDELSESGSYDEKARSADLYDGDIVLNRVSFRYPDGENDVVHDINATIQENSVTAFVGASGAGKSTVLDLIVGLLQPTAGEITCGGRPIDEDPAAWHAILGVVPQDVFLLNDTLAANVAFGVPRDRIDPAMLDEALDLAELVDVVAALPEGCETILGERGVRLSGGQRQRVGLARALYRRPRVLVLDEATSALDNETEREIADTLRRLQGRMTVIVVAHRLSTVRGATKLVFLSGGGIAGEGDFAEIRRSVPEFERLVALGEMA